MVQGGSGLHPWVYLLHAGCWCWARCLVPCPAGWEQGPWGWSLIFVGAGGEHPKYTARDGSALHGRGGGFKERGGTELAQRELRWLLGCSQG